ncbi:hypothetical protein OSTOST_19943, partial [Ostertagia ostertagi]
VIHNVFELANILLILLSNSIIEHSGGYRHVGAYGIIYQEDQNPVGIVSDYGSRYIFPNVPIEDRKLYETERYHNGDLTYTFDIAKDGEYVIVLKFSEVYFQSSGQKVRIYRTFLIHEARNMKADNTYM